MSARRRLSLGQWSACGATGLLIASCLTAYGMYSDALSIDTEQIDPDAWGGDTTQIEGVYNILMLGVDEESEGLRPDVLVIANINVDEGAVTLVNLPRDLIVDIPPCEATEEYPGWDGGLQQINHSATYGGLDCLGNTVQSVTDIHLDHLVMVNFAGFEDIVDSIGGVELCIPEAIDDPKAHLQLEAGEQTLSGEEALGLARSRDSTENRDDMGRIQSQQRLMGAILREVTSGDTMSSPTTLYAFVDSVTDSITTDDTLTVDTMRELAGAAREIDLDRMTMVMVPVVDSQTHEYKVDPGPGADELFAAVAAGEVQAADEEDEGEGGGEDDAAEEEAEAPVEPSDVSVRILNGTGTDGLAGQVEPLLVQEGFTVTGRGNPEARSPEMTTVYHGPGQQAEAELLASALTSAVIEEVPDLEGDLELVMSGGWGPVVGLDGASDGSDGGGDGGALDGLDTSTAAEDEVSCA